MTGLSIDLETLSTKPNAAVLSIGLAFFNETGVIHGEHYTLPVDIQVAAGRSVSTSTIGWWLQQDAEARRAVSAAFEPGSREEIVNILQEIRQLIGNFTLDEVWGYAASFDCSILEDLFDQFGVAVPWTYKQVRCLRTFAALLPNVEKPERVGTHHNALDDATFQAQWVLRLRGALNGQAT